MSLPTASEKNSENICIYTVYYSGNATFGMFMAGPRGFGGKYNLLEYRTSDCMDQRGVCENENYETKLHNLT